MEAVLPPAKGHPGWLAAARSWHGPGRALPESFPTEEDPAAALVSRFQLPASSPARLVH